MPASGGHHIGLSSGVCNIRLYSAKSSDSNPGIPNPEIPESRPFLCPNPGITGLQNKLVVLFCVLNDRNKNFSRLVNKIFMCTRGPLFAVRL